MQLAALPTGPLELHSHRSRQPAVVIRDDEIDPMQPASLEPAEERAPAALRLAVAQLEPQDFAVALFVDTGGDQSAARAHLPVLAHVDDERIYKHEAKARAAEVTHVPRLDERVESLAQIG